MGMPAASDQQGPMAAMNMTPLIDVLLVLLIMFIITIPIASHAVEIDIGTSDQVPDVLSPVSNKIIITADDRILWNAQPVSEAELASLLKLSADLDPEPELHFEPEARASYDSSARALRLIKLSGVTNFGFVGNEKYRSFESE